jgi:hypothetical protein
MSGELMSLTREELISEVLRLREENEALRKRVAELEAMVNDYDGLTWEEYCRRHLGMRSKAEMVKLVKSMFDVPSDLSRVHKPVKFSPKSREFEGYVLDWVEGSILTAVITKVGGKNFRNLNSSNMCMSEISGGNTDNVINQGSVG